MGVVSKTRAHDRLHLDDRITKYGAEAEYRTTSHSFVILRRNLEVEPACALDGEI